MAKKNQNIKQKQYCKRFNKPFLKKKKKRFLGIFSPTSGKPHHPEPLSPRADLDILPLQYGPQALHTTLSLLLTCSFPRRRHSLCKRTAPWHTHSRTVPHPQTHAELSAASFILHWLTVMRTHFLFLLTGSWNEIVSAKSNPKRWVNNSRKLVQVPLRLETERRKICSITTGFTLPTKWNTSLIFLINSNS